VKWKYAVGALVVAALAGAVASAVAEAARTWNTDTDKEI
jgi:hypothetical protein